jgi:IclR family transcriptional regulator, pca regulon regulatory protein
MENSNIRSRTDHVQSIERGMAVLKSFNVGNSRMTLSQIAEITGLTRATSRRFLLTLTELGYVGNDGHFFYLEPKLLELGYSYLSSLSFDDVIQKNLNVLADRLQESASAAVLDFPNIVYVARASITRIISIGLSVGTKLPAIQTSMGRVMLSQLPLKILDQHLSKVKLELNTEYSLKTMVEVRNEIIQVSQQGWCLVDQEFEIGLRSIAVPIGSHINNTFAAINVAVPVARVSKDEVVNSLLPELLKTANTINKEIRLIWPS